MTKRHTAFITGASAGLGEEFARALHQRGYHVVLSARREERLRKLAGELGEGATVVPSDLSDPNDIRAKDYLENNHVDLLINNAGRGLYGKFHTHELKDEQSLVTLNLVAPVTLTHAVLPQMLQRRSGGVINVSSIAAYQAIPLLASYAASKAFNYYFSTALTEELRAHNIHVMALCPGPTATEFREKAKFEAGVDFFPGDTIEHVVKKALKDFDRKKQISFPSLKAHVMAFGSTITPTPISAKIMKWLLRVK